MSQKKHFFFAEVFRGDCAWFGLGAGLIISGVRFAHAFIKRLRRVVGVLRPSLQSNDG